MINMHTVKLPFSPVQGGYLFPQLDADLRIRLIYEGPERVVIETPFSTHNVLLTYVPSYGACRVEDIRKVS
jgi:hypothetical protein